MRFDIVTIFPGYFESVFAQGIVRRALKGGLVTVETHDLRAFAHDRHRTVDDRPFGGGEGMVLKAEPLAEALSALGVRTKAERGDSEAASGRAGEAAGQQVSESARQRVSELASQRVGKAASEQASEAARERVSGSAKQSATAGEPTVNGETAKAQEADPSASSRQGGTPLRMTSHIAAKENSAQDDKSVAGTRVILLSAQGRLFTQRVARELAALERVVLVCGRYEGVDERVNELYCDMELSIGDYVLSGGEAAAAVVVDATMRLIPGVLGNEASGEFESFGAADAEIDVDVEGVPRSQHGAGGLLDYPQYTRPAEFGGLRAPEVLMNGDHAEIRRWRREQQLRKTLKNRPELLERAALSAEDARMIAKIRDEKRHGEEPRNRTGSQS